MVTAHHTHISQVTASAYQENRSYVLGVLARRCRWLDPSDREALFHDAYVVLLEKQRTGTLNTAAMSSSQLRAYLVQTALNKAMDERKSAWRRLSTSLEHDEVPIELPSRERPVDERVLAQAEGEHVRAIVAGLPARRQKVIELRFFQERTPDEIQRHLGVSERVYRRELERGKRTVSERYLAVARDWRQRSS